MGGGWGREIQNSPGGQGEVLWGKCGEEQAKRVIEKIKDSTGHQLHKSWIWESVMGWGRVIVFWGVLGVHFDQTIGLIGWMEVWKGRWNLMNDEDLQKLSSLLHVRQIGVLSIFIPGEKTDIFFTLDCIWCTTGGNVSHFGGRDNALKSAPTLSGRNQDSPQKLKKNCCVNHHARQSHASMLYYNLPLTALKQCPLVLCVRRMT